MKVIVTIFLIMIFLTISSVSGMVFIQKANALFVNIVDCKYYFMHNPPQSTLGVSVPIPSHNIKQLCVDLLSVNGSINSLTGGVVKCEQHIMIHETAILSNPRFNPLEISFICNNLNPLE